MCLPSDVQSVVLKEILNSNDVRPSARVNNEMSRLPSILVNRTSRSSQGGDGGDR